MNPRNVFLPAIWLALVLTMGPDVQARQAHAPTAAETMPLDRYVEEATPAFRYELVHEQRHQGMKHYVLRLVSQSWLSAEQVRQPEWWHWVSIVVPDVLRHDAAFLYIGGGHRGTARPGQPRELLLQIARNTGTIAARVHNVPNQPVFFAHEDGRPLYEDALIASAWDQFLQGGAQEPGWLPRLPMTNAVVRTMDALQDFSKKQTSRPLKRFFLAGGSKRGWTTWTAAAVDPRVMGIAPMVIDLLNIVPSFRHHWRAYGEWARAVDDYVEAGIMDWQGSREFRELARQVEPFAYRARLDLPKLIINAAGDEFFPPDSWQFYLYELPGETHLRYVPNSGHRLPSREVFPTLQAFYTMLLADSPRPRLDWSTDGQSLTVAPSGPPEAIRARLWTATNPDARDFRLSTIGRAWEARELEADSRGTFHARLETPGKGWRAGFIEVEFPGPFETPLKLTTGVILHPGLYPHPPFESGNPRGTPLNAAETEQ